MRFLYAHAGESHTNATDNVVHTVQSDWPKILLVTAIFVVIMLAIVYIATNKTKQQTKKSAKKDAPDASEE